MWQIKYAVSNLVARHPGTLPVLITCPHGGEVTPADVLARDGRSTPAGCDFETNKDLNTREITVGVAQRMLDIFGQAPHVVIAEFHRRCIDANRSRRCAFEVPAAGKYYDEYHNTLRAFVDEIRAENGGLGLLFDIHGTLGIPADPAAVYLGTDNGQTVARLLAADPNALWRPCSLRRFLEAAGHVVSPQQRDVPETPAVSGGFTVRTYGSSNADGLDAMQVEIDDALRNNPDERNALIEVLAFAIGNLVTRYADCHALTAAQSIALLDARRDVAVAGDLRRRPDSNDAGLRLGGLEKHRGRVEIRHAPGSPRRAGVLVLHDELGRDYFVWADTQGKLRISPTDPGGNSQAGQLVGGPA
jgi:N-formylglutamate amidohydrolase